MKEIQEAARTVAVMAETEVLVVGSGPGGLAAALASARQGAETMLMERFGCFGGNITQAGVESIAWYRHPETIEAGGIGMEFERRAVEMNAATPEVQSISHALNTEIFKYVADRLVIESGVHPLLHCYFVEPVMDGANIIGVITESKSGRQAILARRVIDATGDADIAARAGAPYTQAPLTDRLGVTVSFACSGVDKKRFMEHVAANPGSYRAVGRRNHRQGRQPVQPLYRRTLPKSQRGRRDTARYRDRRDMVFHFRRGRGILPECRLHPGPRLHQCLGPDPGRNGRAPAGHVGHRGAQ